MKKYKVTYKLINIKVFSLIYESQYEDVEITKSHVQGYLGKYFNPTNFKILELKEVS